MLLTRRSWLQTIAALAAVPREGSDVRSRASRIVQAYSDQGDHRTATRGDAQSAVWLAREVVDTGLSPSREPFPLDRLDIVQCLVESGGRTVDAMPLFDGTFTDAAGVRGRLAAASGSGEIALLDLTPNAAGAGAVGEARRQSPYRAVIAVTRGGRPGLCPSNADSFTAPFGPPVVQVSSVDADWLSERARTGAETRVVARVQRTSAFADNVVATIAGRNRSLPPLVVMTPRSGWYACASERGGGLACWLELMRALKTPRPVRDIVFVASSGHELGHLGLNAFVARRPGIVTNAVAWMHFGANIGAATEPGITVQASDDESEARLATAMTAAGLGIDRRVARGTIPGGEAEVVHRGGGKYVSVIGRNGLFHNPADRGASTVDPAAIARFVDAFVAYAASTM